MVYRLVLLFFVFTSFNPAAKDPFIVVLGVAQDAGYPQIGCDKSCCKKFWDKKIAKQKVACLALFDPLTNQKWIFDATPDLTEQLHTADQFHKGKLSGIFLTHAHVGHYTGLMYLVGKPSKSSTDSCTKGCGTSLILRPGTSSSL